MGLLYYYNRRNGSDRIIYQQIYEGLCSYSGRIKINRTAPENAYSIFGDVLNDHPELAVVDSSQIHSESSLTELWIIPSYWFPVEQVYDCHMRFLDECVFIANRITDPQASDIEKEIAIHDFMARNIEYGYCNAGTQQMGEKLSQSVFGTLFERKGVCKGISMLFKCFADLVGLNAMVIQGEIFEDDEWVPHAWNIVFIDGQSMFVDVTYDIGAYQFDNLLTYERFNFSDSDAAGNYRWDKKKYPISCKECNIGYYQYNNLLVKDEYELRQLLTRDILNRKNIFYFQIRKDSGLLQKSQSELAQLVLNILCEITKKGVSMKYIINVKSGKCVVEVKE